MELLKPDWFVLFFSFPHQVSKKYVSKELAKEIHAKAAPFVKWLKEAEEESEGSEEEEEEEDENVEVSEKPKLFCSIILFLSGHISNHLLMKEYSNVLDGLLLTTKYIGQLQHFNTQTLIT